MIGNEYIGHAIDELVDTLGVKEDTSHQDLVDLLKQGDITQCITGIAQSFGLPVEIRLQYVPKNFRPGSATRFETRDLARTDASGRAIGGITAQVAIPRNLPLYGSATLSRFPITLKVSENCADWPLAFMAVIAHELSHVLLASLNHPQKENEFYTDLTPMVLGYSRLMEEGRKCTETTTSGNVTTTQTTTYGYLTDEQFSFARGNNAGRC